MKRVSIDDESGGVGPPHALQVELGKIGRVIVGTLVVERFSGG